MTNVDRYDRDTYLEDIKILRAEGLTMGQIAQELGISRATLYRILAGN